MKGRTYGPGERVGKSVYRVIRHLASGGMGTVYDVEDITVGKRYVLKTLHPDLFGRNDLARRMDAEARVLGRLAHPNIVEVITAGTTEDDGNLPYYVMERLNGQNLRTILEKRGRLDATHALRIAIDLLDALDHAHENGVVHRDVKPENIFLHRNLAGTTTTKLLDFGIIRLLDGAKKSETAGRFVGTLRYAAPEQFRGEGMGPHTDIYSAGLTLYEMLCGAGPFDGARTPQAIAAAHATAQPPPLSNFGKVSPAVERIVMRALEKAPQERYRDAFTFASDLRRELLDEGTSSVADTAANPLSYAPDSRVAKRPSVLPSTRREGSGAAPDEHLDPQVTARDARTESPSTPAPALAHGGTQLSPNEGASASTTGGAAIEDADAYAETAMVDAGVQDHPTSVRAGTLVDRSADTRVGAPRIPPRHAVGTDTEILDLGGRTVPDARSDVGARLAGRPGADTATPLASAAGASAGRRDSQPMSSPSGTMPTRQHRPLSVAAIATMAAVGVAVGLSGVAAFAMLTPKGSVTRVAAPLVAPSAVAGAVGEPSSLMPPAPMLTPPGLDEPPPAPGRATPSAPNKAPPLGASSAARAFPKPSVQPSVKGASSAGTTTIPHVAFD